MSKSSDRSQNLLCHLDAAYNLARWLMRNEQDAKDVVQDAFILALRFNGEVESLKAWFLAIVRNSAYKAMKKRLPTSSEDELQVLNNEVDPRLSPEQKSLQMVDIELIRSALDEISEEHREVFVLYEIEELTYQETAEVLGIPIGTVMSRLARSKVKILNLIQQQEKVEGENHGQ